MDKISLNILKIKYYINKIYTTLEISGGNRKDYNNYDDKDITIKHYINKINTYENNIKLLLNKNNILSQYVNNLSINNTLLNGRYKDLLDKFKFYENSLNFLQTNFDKSFNASFDFLNNTLNDKFKSTTNDLNNNLNNKKNNHEINLNIDVKDKRLDFKSSSNIKNIDDNIGGDNNIELNKKLFDELDKIDNKLQKYINQQGGNNNNIIRKGLENLDENLLYIYDKYLIYLNDEDKIDIIEYIINNIYDIDNLINKIKSYIIYNRYIEDIINILNNIYFLDDNILYDNIYKYNIKDRLNYIYELISIIDVNNDNIEFNKEKILKRYNDVIYNEILEYIEKSNENKQKIIYIINKL